MLHGHKSPGTSRTDNLKFLSDCELTHSLGTAKRVASTSLLVLTPQEVPVTQLIKCGTMLRAAGACAIVLAYGCAADPGETDVQQASNSHTEIHPEDDCDPATFGALCRAGAKGGRSQGLTQGSNQ